MEKLIYVLWRHSAEPAEALGVRLRGDACEHLAALGAQRIQVNVVDEAVAAGSHISRCEMKPAPSALISFWLNAAHGRRAFEAALANMAARVAGYQTAKSTVLPHEDAPGTDDRIRGFSQIALLYKHPALSHRDFLEFWMREQTPVALETQDTHYYCQNIVVRALTPGAPAWDGVVEEFFPLEALTDPLVYWNACGREDTCEANRDRVMASNARFLDIERATVMVTSAYRHGGWRDPAPEATFKRPPRPPRPSPYSP